MNRTKLCDRTLPHYTQGEETMNMVTHIVGGGLAVIGFLLCILQAAHHGSITAIVCTAIYGTSLVAVYAMSSIYHGLHPCTGKKVMQVMDHCAIYFLIAGTYTPIVLCAIAPVYPAIGWGLLIAEWCLAAIATVLTAIDLHNYRVFSMACYICMGWGVIFFIPQTMEVMTPAGFYLLLAGGIAYTIGAVIFGLGKRIKWMHSVFHLFVIAGSVLQLISVLLFVL